LRWPGRWGWPSAAAPRTGQLVTSLCRHLPRSGSIGIHVELDVARSPTSLHEPRRRSAMPGTRPRPRRSGRAAGLLRDSPRATRPSTRRRTGEPAPAAGTTPGRSRRGEKRPGWFSTGWRGRRQLAAAAAGRRGHSVKPARRRRGRTEKKKKSGLVTPTGQRPQTGRRPSAATPNDGAGPATSRQHAGDFSG